MRTRLEIIQDAIYFLEVFEDMLDNCYKYETIKMAKILKSANNIYLQILIDFLDNYGDYEIKGEHLKDLVNISIEGKKELLEITRDL